MTVPSISRFDQKHFVTITRHPGWLGRLLGRKTTATTYWSRNRFDWFTQTGDKVTFRQYPNPMDLLTMVEEHEARVELFGDTLA